MVKKTIVVARSLFVLGLCAVMSLLSPAAHAVGWMQRQTQPQHHRQHAIFSKEALSPASVHFLQSWSVPVKIQFLSSLRYSPPQIFAYSIILALVALRILDAEALTYFPVFMMAVDAGDSPLERMKSELTGMSKSSLDLWRDTLLFVDKGRRFLTKEEVPDDPVAREHVARQELINGQLFTWLRAKRDPALKLTSALLDLHLASRGYPWSIRGMNAALDHIATLEAGMDNLLYVANRSSDFIVINAALDRIREKKGEDEWKSFSRDMLPVDELTDSQLLPALIILARVDREAMRRLLQDRRMEIALLQRFGLPDIAAIHMVLDVLTLNRIHMNGVQRLIESMRVAFTLQRAKGQDRDILIMLLMLLVLQSMAESIEKYLTPDEIQAIQNQITRTRWTSPEEGVSWPPTFGRVAYLVGEMVFRKTDDPAVTAMHAYLFELSFLETYVNVRNAGAPHPHITPEVRFIRELKQGIPDPVRAAQLQLSAFVETAESVGKFSLPWSYIYQWAVTMLPQKMSLSETGRALADQFVGEYAQEHTAELVRSRAKDRSAKRWRVFFPTENEIGPGVTHSQYDAVENVSPNKSAAWYEKQFRQIFLPALVDPGHFNRGKTIYLVMRMWDMIESVIFNRTRLNSIPIQYLETHVTDRCQNACWFCRGQLRAIPSPEASLSGEALIHLVGDLHRINPEAYHRTSGSVGDPGKNPETWQLLHALNTMRHPHGITLDGLQIQPDLMKEMVANPEESSTEWIHISLDAGSNRTYNELKKMRRHVELPPGIPGPFDIVMLNIDRLIERRKTVNSKVKIAVSVLVQHENIHEIEGLAAVLKEKGVDVYQIKIQHYDSRRNMPQREIRNLYRRTLPRLISMFQDEKFQIDILQDEAEALAKNSGRWKKGQVRQKAANVSSINFSRCRIALWNLVVGADGAVHPCCQYFGRTLPSFGNVHTHSLDQIWHGDERFKVLNMDPREYCGECAPVDLFMNRFMYFLEQVAQSPHRWLIKEFHRILLEWWEIEKERQKTLSGAA